MSSPVKVNPKDYVRDITDGVIQDVKELSNEEDIDHKFATETSLHGVGLIATAQNLLVKIIWTIIVLSMCGVLIWQIAELLIHFFKYVPVTEVRIEVSWLKLIAFTTDKYRRKKLEGKVSQLQNYKRCLQVIA